jgi:hypothetical protein
LKSKDYFGIIRNIVEHFGIVWNKKKHYGINIVEHFGHSFWAFILEFFVEIFGNFALDLTHSTVLRPKLKR